MKIFRSLVITFILLGALVLKADAPEKEKPVVFNDFTIWDFYVPRLPNNPKIEKKELHLRNRIFEKIKYAEFEITVMKKESLGWYFITAYCPSECGYNGENYPTGWQTASGTICHRADYEHRYSEPTTCAISRSVHNFGTEFFIPEFDRVFIAEDTGPGVQGKHLDLFYEDYNSVISFPTGYYEVFSVSYEKVTVRLCG